jgi:hypothetical protein
VWKENRRDMNKVAGEAIVESMTRAVGRGNRTKYAERRKKEGIGENVGRAAGRGKGETMKRAVARAEGIGESMKTSVGRGNMREY